MKTLSGHEIAARVNATPGDPSGEYVPAAVALELLAALERASQGVARMITDGGHLACWGPNEAVRTLERAKAIIRAMAAQGYPIYAEVEEALPCAV